MSEILQFRGDKSAKGRLVKGHTIGLLRDGAAVDIHGTVFATYQRITIDSGLDRSWQVIEFFFGEDDAAPSDTKI